MTLQEFCQHVHGVLCDHYTDREFELNAEAGTIRCGHLRFGMSNLFDEYRQSAVSLAEFDQLIIENFGRAFAMTQSPTSLMPERWDEVVDRLQPQLVSIRLPNMDDAIRFPFSAEVQLAVVVDAPNGYAYVKEHNASQWGKSALEIMEVARANLLKASSGMRSHFVPSERLVVLQTNDGYDAARILVKEIRRGLLQAILGNAEGKILVGIPNRDFLIAWPEDAAEAVQAGIRQQLQLDAQQQHHALSGVPFRVSLESITPLE